MSSILSIISAFISVTALYFTFKKDAHRLRVNHKYKHREWHDILSINNDSSFTVQISAIGCLTEDGSVHWIELVGDYKANNLIDYSIPISGRSTFYALVMHRNLPGRAPAAGYCVQLDCGRTFVSVAGLGTKASVAFKVRSAISWLSSGKTGFPRNELHLRPE